MNRPVNANVYSYLLLLLLLLVAHRVICTSAVALIKLLKGWTRGGVLKKWYPPSTINGSRPKALLSLERRAFRRNETK